MPVRFEDDRFSSFQALRSTALDEQNAEGAKPSGWPKLALPERQAKPLSGIFTSFRWSKPRGLRWTTL